MINNSIILNCSTTIRNLAEMANITPNIYYLNWNTTLYFNIK
jgi:hypothetical protein